MAAEFRYVVPHKFSGITVQQSILDCFPFRETETLLAMLDYSSLKVNLQPAKLEDLLTVNDELCYRLNNYHEPEVNTDWHLLWEGDEIIAVHKPANLPVSRTTRNIYNTLVQLVRRESDWPDAHLLHRLDLETSGIVLLAKTKEWASKWQPKLSSLMAEKTYHAIVYGNPKWDSTVLECELSTRADSPIRCQMHVCDSGQKGKASKTSFKVLQTFEGYSLIECQLLTGRKHQIRAHLAHLGHPIVGDKIYAHDGQYYLKRIENQLTEQDENMIQTNHHLLSAYKVQLQLEEGVEPITVMDENFSATWQTFVSKCRL
ncbi:RluA family pseudouridine synthase [Reinekea marina]|uniref:RluA family pseudouridine synthase n=2 Tax=Reinekea marina TaxID=1310421 RepID=A0ABV7WRS2_9GAMM